MDPEKFLAIKNMLSLFGLVDYFFWINLIINNLYSMNVSYLQVYKDKRANSKMNSVHLE